MGTRLGWLAGAMLLAARGAHAEWSATVTGTTDYDFRGISQTEGDPALQGSLDFTADPFYASIWGSNVDFGDDVDGNLEVDLVAGLAGEIEGGWRWDVGATYYVYPGSNEDLRDLSDPSDDVAEIEDYAEIYAGGGYGPLDLKYWWSPDLYNSSETASYLEANLAFDLPAEFGFVAHYGYSSGDYFDTLESPGGDDAEYADISFALTRTFGRFDTELKLVTTDTDDEFEIDRGPSRNDTRVVFSIGTTFPWSDDE